MRGRAGLAIVVSLLAAACSSGGEDEASPSAPQAADVVVDAMVPSSAVGDAGSVPTEGVDAAAARPTRSGERATSQRDADVAPASSAGTAEPVDVGKGISDDEIELGIVWADTSAYNAAGAALGGSPSFYTPDDSKGLQLAIIDWFNDHGGIAGRRIVPVWHEVRADRAVTREGRTRDAEEACAAFTQDAQTFAFIGSGQWTEDNIVDCAIRTGTLMVDQRVAAGTGIYLSERREEEAGPYYFNLTSMTVEDRERAMIASLDAQGFFTDDAKVGLLIETGAMHRDGVDNVLRPALAKRGVDVVSEVVYPDIIESPWPNYVLQFQSAGVTHVIFATSTAEGAPALFFMRSAENQQYRPRYAITTDSAAYVKANAPVEQVRNAMGFDWLNGRLGTSADYPSTGPNDDACRAILKSEGAPPTNGIGHAFCDFFFFLQHTMAQATALTPAGVAAVAESMGDAWRSTKTFGGITRFGPGRHHGIALIRNIAWSEDAEDFVHTSDPYPIPQEP